MDSSFEKQSVSDKAFQLLDPMAAAQIPLFVGREPDEFLLVKMQINCVHFLPGRTYDLTPFLMIMEEGSQCLFNIQQELDKQRNFVAARERVEAETREFAR